MDVMRVKTTVDVIFKDPNVAPLKLDTCDSVTFTAPNEITIKLGNEPVTHKQVRSVFCHIEFVD